ncbi:MAG: hypothetical protein QM831_04845 [Kofleriaceae bacterium]
MKYVFLSLLAACTSSPLDPGAGDNAGTGTNTLLVTGDALATSAVANSTLSSDFSTAFSIRVALSGADVSTGKVAITTAAGSTPLTYTTTNAEARWTGQVPGYDEVYQLDIDVGSDNIHGVIVDGPDIQAFTSPTKGATVDATLPITATWSRAAAADTATLDAGDGPGITIDDTGTYSITAGTLKADQDKPRTNTLRLERTNHVTPAGAAAGSTFTVGVRTELDVVVAACPSC